MRITNQREALATHIEQQRPTDEAVHAACHEATQLGISYKRIGDALNLDESRALRWSAGADIPERSVERRAILGALVKLLREDDPQAPMRAALKRAVVAFRGKKLCACGRSLPCFRRMCREVVE